MSNWILGIAFFFIVGVYVFVQILETREKKDRAKELEKDLAKQLSAGVIFPRGSVAHKEDITDPVGVTDEVEAITAFEMPSAQADEVAKDLVAQVLMQKSGWEKWGANFTVGVLTLIVGLTVAGLNFFRTELPDCTAYANTLLAIHRQAPTNQAAVAAGTAFEWGSVAEQCGPAADFIAPLGDPPPPSSP